MAPVVDRIIEFLRPYLSAPWGYFIVGAATFLENSVGAGVIVPGETLVIIGGFYARLGELSLAWVAVAACVGAILGDNVGYLIGRRFGRGFLERHGRRLFITPERLERADEYYRSHGGKTVFLGRFIPFVRSVGFILAGVAHMRWRRFLMYDVAGSVVWGIGNAVLGYVIGASYERWKGYLTPVGLGVLVLLLAFILWTRWRGRRREARRYATERLEPGQATGAAGAADLKVDGRPADD
ncbi:MAG: DedA family protein [Actinobacteria bacterium]|nr:MAG: DedA family protein [Actinomycetota bacterium]